MSTEVTTSRQVTINGIAQKSWTFDRGSYATPGDYDEPGGETLPVESVTFSFARRVGHWCLETIIVRCYRGKGVGRDIVIDHVDSLLDAMPLWLAKLAVEAAQESL